VYIKAICSVRMFPLFVFYIAMFRLPQSTKISLSVCPPMQVSYSSLSQMYLTLSIAENSFITNASLDFEYSVLLVNNWTWKNLFSKHFWLFLWSIVVSLLINRHLVKCMMLKYHSKMVNHEVMDLLHLKSMYSILKYRMN
jgi:hypothetical protein